MNRNKWLLLTLCALPTMAAAQTTVQSVDFQNQEPGTYTQADARNDWGSNSTVDWFIGLASTEGASARAHVERYSNGSHVLKVTYPAGTYGYLNNGAQWRVGLPQRDEYVLEYRVKFAPGFEWTKGGKLPGLMGGTAPRGGNYSEDGFSSRYMWHAGGKLVLYFYWADQSSKTRPAGQQYGQTFDLYTTMEPDVSYKIKQRIRLNTPGQYNGEAEFWVNDVQKRKLTGLRFRTANKTWKIDNFIFTSFHGGSTSDYAPTRTNSAIFDNFRIWHTNTSTLSNTLSFSAF